MLLEILLGTALLFFSAMGLIWFWSQITRWFYCSREADACCRLLPVHPEDQAIEYKLRQAEERILEEPSNDLPRLILLDLEADEGTLAVCRAFLRHRDWAVLCTPQDLQTLFEGETWICKRVKGVLY